MGAKDVGAAISTRFKPGMSGNPGGRPRRLLRRPDEVLSALGFCPVEQLMELLPALRPAERAKVWLELLAYCHAKIKEPLVDPETEQFLTMPTQDLIQFVKSKIPDLLDVACEEQKLG